MTLIDDILEQAKQLSPAERMELANRLMVMDTMAPPGGSPKTGAEIVAMLEAMPGPIELVDPHIDDPVEWVMEQRRKRQERLDIYRNDEETE